eukprot:5229822-Prymnesium_polylepis.1
MPLQDAEHVHSLAALPQFLDAEWTRIQREVASRQLSWTKVYFPYWFYQYTEHMGEPRRAPQTNQSMSRRQHMHPTAAPKLAPKAPHTIEDV